jgi:hypothetical protein
MQGLGRRETPVTQSEVGYYHDCHKWIKTNIELMPQYSRDTTSAVEMNRDA